MILDQNGAESLLGMGDMLFLPLGTSKLQRIQGAYVDEEQIAAITDYWRRQGEPEFHEELLEEVESEDDGGGGDDEFDPDEDPLLSEAIALVAQMGTASTSMLQRRLRLGYTRAGRLIDMLERRGVISGYEGSKPRQVLITEGDVPRVLANLAEAGGGAREPVAAEPRRRLARAARGIPPDAGGNPPALDSSPDAGDRRDPARGAHAREDRHLRGRGGDEDPRQVPARAGERGVGPAARAHVRQARSCARTPTTSASTPSCSSRSTACATSIRPSSTWRRSPRTSGPSAARRGSAPPRPSRGWIIGLSVVAILALLIVIGSVGGGKSEQGTGRDPADHAEGEARPGRPRRRARPSPG